MPFFRQFTIHTWEGLCVLVASPEGRSLLVRTWRVLGLCFFFYSSGKMVDWVRVSVVAFFVVLVV